MEKQKGPIQLTEQIHKHRACGYPETRPGTYWSWLQCFYSVNVTIVSLSGFHFNDTALSPAGDCLVSASRANSI